MERIQKLEMRGVTRRFGAATALHSFDLNIAGGTFVTLLGPSGCGKSTALNCLAGLLEPTEGEILLNGRPVQNVPAEKRGFGMVFQNYALFPHLTVARNVSYGLEIRGGIAKAERERRVQQALELVHLDAFAKRYPAQLSGGQQQRLAIARTIVLEPSLLLLDEPLSNLDAKLRNEMRVEIKRLHDHLKLTTIYVTHDQSEAMSLSDLVLVMRLGQIEQTGSPQEIFNRPKSLYVADFMGYANRLPVEILGREGEEWVVQTTGGTRLRAVATTDGVAWQSGQKVLACFRADDTVVDATPLQNRLKGKLRLVEYLGKSFEGIVQLEDSPDSELFVQSQRPLENGETVEFGIQPDRVLLFSPDETITPTGNRADLGQPVLKGER